MAPLPLLYYIIIALKLGKSTEKKYIAILNTKKNQEKCNKRKKINQYFDYKPEGHN